MKEQISNWNEYAQYFLREYFVKQILNYAVNTLSM